MAAAWRIVKRRHAADAFDGEGARITGGRWNTPGVGVVYCSDSRALATLEVLVHLHNWSAMTAAYVLIGVSFDERLVEMIAPDKLPRTWRTAVAAPELQHLGDEWVAQRRSTILRVPSAVIAQEFNYVLNPAHPDFHRVQIGPAESFEFDARLTKRGGKPRR